MMTVGRLILAEAPAATQARHGRAALSRPRVCYMHCAHDRLSTRRADYPRLGARLRARRFLGEQIATREMVTSDELDLVRPQPHRAVPRMHAPTFTHRINGDIAGSATPTANWGGCI